ncbi:hypothetical protein BVX98_07725 [bacterium F11]|nr:hypothetical protein BVX98_07725 [bacterium F11]
MGIEILRLGEDKNIGSPPVNSNELASVSFKRHIISQPPMSIWMMTLDPNRQIFPWWGYLSTMDEDMDVLSQNYSISSAQQLFDCLFLHHLYRLGGKNLCVIFPGSIKSNGWGDLREGDRSVFLKGQACIYHLDASLGSKMNINWVPFYHPQSLVRAPRFENLWRLFASNQDDNSETSCLTFFSLSDVRMLPEVIKLLLQEESNRSERLSKLVDWFGVYSSPLKTGYTTSSVIYTANKWIVTQLGELEKKLSNEFEGAKREMLDNPIPRSALRIINRSIVL